MQPQTLRGRIQAKVIERYGDLSAGSIRKFATDAGKKETTVGRFVCPERYRQPTDHPRESTIRSFAIALDVNYAWLTDGVGSEQLGVWPVLIGEVSGGDPPSPIEELGEVIDAVQHLNAELQHRACRAAIGCIVEVVAEAGAHVPAEAYRAMIRLDAQRRDEEPAA